MSLVINNNLMAANVARNLNNHYGRLATSTERLSSGLRINSAADDAAGLAIRELQRADIATLQQGARNANDAVSLIQTADGAMQVIDNQLIRMKELAEQAATGTYNSTQRLMIESEYQSLASEITRIANATDFNGIKLLDGTLSGAHDGSQLNATGALKVHFGTSNDSAEDYYYIQIGNVTASALGLGNNRENFDNIITIVDYETAQNAGLGAVQSTTYNEIFTTETADIEAILSADQALGGGVIPGLTPEDANRIATERAEKAATNAANVDQLMTQAAMDYVYDEAYAANYTPAYDANILAGMTPVDAAAAADETAVKVAADAVLNITEQMAATGTIIAPMTLPARTADGANAYIEQAGQAAYDSAYAAITADIYGRMDVTTLPAPPLNTTEAAALQTAIHAEADRLAEEARAVVIAEYEGVYAGAYVAPVPVVPENSETDFLNEQTAQATAWAAMEGHVPVSVLDAHVQYNGTIATVNRNGVSEPIAVAGSTATGAAVNTAIGAAQATYITNGSLVGPPQGVVAAAEAFAQKLGTEVAGGTIATQEGAQEALVAINEAIISKDKIRAHLGAIQNRLGRTIDNLEVQAENMQAAESRISDVDVAVEMTEFVRNQILTQSAVAMLAQANSLPKMAQQLIGG